MINLLIETQLMLNRLQKTPDDVIFIGSQDGEFACTWEEFQLLANQEYDNGYGAQKVACDLIIVFNDNSYLDRSEYDGSENWRYNFIPKPQTTTKPIKSLFCTEDQVGWCFLKEIQQAEPLNL
jgi:hypothetical protein